MCVTEVERGRDRFKNSNCGESVNKKKRKGNQQEVEAVFMRKIQFRLESTAKPEVEGRPGFVGFTIVRAE